MSERRPWAADLTEATTLGRLEIADGVAAYTGDVWRLAVLSVPLPVAGELHHGAALRSDRLWCRSGVPKPSIAWLKGRTRAIPVGESRCLIGPELPSPNSLDIADEQWTCTLIMWFWWAGWSGSTSSEMSLDSQSARSAWTSQQTRVCSPTYLERVVSNELSAVGITMQSGLLRSEGNGVDVAGHLRNEELQALRSAVRDGNVEHALKQLNERGRAQELVRQQYTGRYPFELLQNANDAANELGLEEGRSAYFLLTETALIVADDGAGFHDPQIRSISSLGASTKGPGTAIGHKGLGFKSVGEITARPQIVSRSSKFQFDETRVRAEVEDILGPLPTSQRFPVYAFPFPLSDEELGNDATAVRELLDGGYATVIRLPFAEGVVRETVACNLRDHLIPNLLLFLPSIGHLELHGTGHDFVATIVHEQDGPAWNALLEVNGEVEQWLIYPHRFAPEREQLAPLGDGWTDIKTINVSIAVPRDEAGRPRTNTAYPLSVYFPTDEFAGLRLIVHAEWVLTLDRKHISDTPEASPLNQAILTEVADFVSGTFAVDLVERFAFTREAVHALVPAWSTAVTPGFGAQLHQLWMEALAKSAFIPTVGGGLQRPSELRMLPARLSNAELAHRYAELSQSATIRPDLERVKALRELISRLAPDAEISFDVYAESLREPEHNDLVGYYRFLMSCRQAAGEAFMRALTAVPSVVTTHGEWVAPGSTTVFLPRTRGEVDIPDDIPVPIAVVPEGVDKLEKFIEDLGVKPFQWRPIIENFLMVVLRDPGADPEQREHALNSLRAYHQQRRGDETPPELGDTLLPARTVDHSEHELRPGGGLYFPSAWIGSPDLELLYGPFGETEFLDVEPPRDPDELATARSFYEMLGVDGRPWIDAQARPGGLTFDWSFPHASPLFFEWLKQPQVNAIANGCPAGHPASQRLKESYQVDRLPEILDSKDPARLRALWRQLAEHWDYYKPAMRAMFRCTASAHTGERDRPTDSFLAYTLHSRAWIPVTRGGEEELVRPTDAWYEAPDTPRKIRLHIPRIHAQFLQGSGGNLARALDLTDAARPSIDDLVTLLGRLAADADEAGEVNSDLTAAARWVQRRLNDHIHADVDPHPEPQGVRLLARHAGIKKFVAQPAYTEDHLLRNTWEALEPILISDTQPRSLARYLSLTSLDRTVKTVPQATGIHHPDSEAWRAIRNDIEPRKPFVLALISAENQNVDELAESRLRALELIACEGLELQYVRGDVQMPRPDAPCYIDSRVERQGRTNRRIGTAYLRLLPDDTGNRPDWHAFASQLAEFLEVPGLSDALATLFTASSENRWSMLAQHSVERSDVEDARQRLQSPELDDDELDTLARVLPTETTYSKAGATPYGSVSGGATAEAPASGEPVSISATSAGPAVDEVSASASVPALPPVDYSRVELVDAQPVGLAAAAPTPGGGARPGGGNSAPPSLLNEQLKRDVGTRGEEVVWKVERARLASRGLDPELVDWVSERDALSPYDMTSVEDGQRIYIEVKATIGSSPTDPFEISRGELVMAAIHRSRFYIYRVTNANSEAPMITRFRDPFGIVMDKKGQIILSNAAMTLTNESADDNDEDIGRSSSR